MHTDFLDKINIKKPGMLLVNSYVHKIKCSKVMYAGVMLYLKQNI